MTKIATLKCKSAASRTFKKIRVKIKNISRIECCSCSREHWKIQPFERISGGGVNSKRHPRTLGGGGEITFEEERSRTFELKEIQAGQSISRTFKILSTNWRR